jgi:hypothetical protein
VREPTFYETFCGDYFERRRVRELWLLRPAVILFRAAMIRKVLMAAVVFGLSMPTVDALGQPPGSAQPPQAPGRGRGAGAEFAGPPQGPNALPIVEVVGCLEQGVDRSWALARATEPARAPAGWSRPEEVQAAAATPLGMLRLPLIGLVEMNPDEHKGHKVVLKGLLITGGGGNRLNVTSIMTASQTCDK